MPRYHESSYFSCFSLLLFSTKEDSHGSDGAIPAKLCLSNEPFFEKVEGFRCWLESRVRGVGISTSSTNPLDSNLTLQHLSKFCFFRVHHTGHILRRAEPF